MRRLYLFTTIIIAVSACKKNDTKPIAMPDPLTTKPWKIALNDNNTATNPKSVSILYNAWPNCNNDDTFTFDNNGVLNVNRGTARCDVSEPTNTILTYTIDKINNKITIDNTIFTLAELSDTQLKYYIAVPTLTGIQYVVFIYQH